MIMGNNHVIFLPIQIEYLKCEFWEFESTQNHLWLIFNKCLKLAKLMPYYFYCMCSTIILRVVLFYLDRENSEHSREIYFTNFGCVEELILIFEWCYWIEFKIKRKGFIQNGGLGGKRNWAEQAGPARLLCEREVPDSGSR